MGTELIVMNVEPGFTSAIYENYYNLLPNVPAENKPEIFWRFPLCVFVCLFESITARFRRCVCVR